MKEENNKSYTELIETELEHVDGGATLSTAPVRTPRRDIPRPSYGPKRIVTVQRICPVCKQLLEEFNQPLGTLAESKLIHCSFCNEIVSPDIVEIRKYSN